MEVTVTYPFPEYAWPRVWSWIESYPRLFLDDDGPHSAADLVALMEKQPFTFAAVRDGEIVGAVWFELTRPDAGVIHTAFARRAWGREVTDTVFHQVAKLLFAAPLLRKIVSIFYADNQFARAMVKRFGFHFDGVLRAEAMRGGVAVDMELWSLLREEYERREARGRSDEHDENNEHQLQLDADVHDGAVGLAIATGEPIRLDARLGRDDAEPPDAAIGGDRQHEQPVRGPVAAAAAKPQRPRVRKQRKTGNRTSRARRVAD